jgi:succinate dehydrogenase/fumarate reductase flavoprotein subunit
MELQPSLPEQWDMEADVVVVGFGAAGAAAAITAQALGANVLLLEKAPTGQEGGNSGLLARGTSTPRRSTKPSPISPPCVDPIPSLRP